MRTALVAEFLFLFVVLPAVFTFYPLPTLPIAILWLLSLYCYVVLARQPDFDRRSFWGASAVGATARAILLLFLPAAGLLATGVYAIAPDLFLGLPRERPYVWGTILVLYPIFSVVPQTVIYRGFIFHRYRELFPKPWALILASALAFSWLHIVMRNPLAPALTLPAGVLFAWRYARSNSVLVSAFEHALYGCMIFTIGLGAYFYTGDKL